MKVELSVASLASSAYNKGPYNKGQGRVMPTIPLDIRHTSLGRQPGDRVRPATSLAPVSLHLRTTNLEEGHSFTGDNSAAALELDLNPPPKVSEKPRHSAPPPLPLHLCPCNSSPSPEESAVRGGVRSGTGVGYQELFGLGVKGNVTNDRIELGIPVLPLLKGEPNQRVLTIPNLRQGTGCFVLEDANRLASPSMEELDPAQLCPENTWCHPGRENTASLHLPRRNWILPRINSALTTRGAIQGGRTLPRFTFHGGIGPCLALVLP
ncbi:hypothetical protein E2C01_008968 [Portunus trituberculatus]|uniref:Uncharacterized protein n=1 Tax=Portunus trituberculatus TaxID=210409 RepID=A0A5B7D3Q2_PORTR|nr:hypothetical protein [Portunus trituberculatus]